MTTTVSVSEDEMTGKSSAYASSAMTSATKAMGFPYKDVQTWLGVGCDGKSEWVYVGYTTSPNLNNTETKDGYSLIHTRIKWGSEVENVTLSQNWGSKFLHFSDYKKIISKVIKSNSILLELNWHGEGSRYFKYSLNGSSVALKKLRSKCANY